ncbi:MAG: HNH endonuclease [Eubacteriales bacterium]
MKRIVAVLLCVTLLCTGCAKINTQQTENEKTYDSVSVTNSDTIIMNEPDQQIDLSDENSLSCYVENTVYTELLEKLDPESFFIENVSATYISDEYLKELEYNSRTNIFFGYSLYDLNSMYQGTRYVFTLDESGQTAVEELVEIKDDTYDKVIKNIAIGTGIIMVWTTVAVITKNPAASTTATKTIKFLFTISSNGAKEAALWALKTSFVGGTVATIVEAIKTGDLSESIKAGITGASEGFKVGAIFGTINGIADGIRIVGNTRFFPNGSEQALKYPEGVEFTKNSNGSSYPRFEKWAKATAKFDTPTLENALNHTGLSGNYYWDAKLANAQCGLSQTPKGYVWHHVEDMKTMILIPQDIHSIAMGGMYHTGGASLIREMLGL